MWNQTIPVGLQMEHTDMEVKMMDMVMRELSDLVEKIKTQEDGFQLNGSEMVKAMAVA